MRDQRAMLPLLRQQKAKLILKGINPANFTATSDDDSGVIDKLKAVATEMGVKV